MAGMQRDELTGCIQYLSIKLLSNRATERTSAVALLLCLHGLRESEAINLACKDVKVKTQRIFVRTLKGGINRYVTIDDVTWTALLRERTNAALTGSIRVLTNSRGKPLDCRNLRRTWYRWRQKFACENYRIHDLRHTTARVVYEESGFDPFAVKTVLGHKRIETTFGYLSRGSEDLGKFMPTTSHLERMRKN